MSIPVGAIRPGFGADIIGIDISRPVRPATMATLWASHILGIGVADSRLLLMELTEKATCVAPTYRHVADFLMWEHNSRVVRQIITSEPSMMWDHLAGRGPAPNQTITIHQDS
jgi:hypothetical protein